MSEPSPVPGNEPERPLVEIKPVEPGRVRLHRPLDAGAEQRAALGRLLELGVQGAVATRQVWQSGNLYRIVLSPEMQKAIKDGVAEIRKGDDGLYSMIADKVTGRFVKHAQFKPAEMAKLANVVTVAWQVAAMVTSQHYLTEINDKLEAITGQLGDLSHFLEDKERAQLLSALQAMKRGRNLLGTGNLAEHDLRVIEESARQAYQVAEAQIEHRLLTMNRLLEQAPAWDQASQVKTLEQLGQQTQVLALALTTLTQAFTVGAASGWSTALTDTYRSSGEQTLARIQDTLIRVDALPRSPAAKLDLNVQRPTPWLLKAPKAVAEEVTYRVKNYRGQQRARQQTRNEQTLDQHMRPSAKQIDDLEDMLTHAHQAAALPSEATPLALLARLNEHGEVIEIFSDVAVAAD